MIRARRWSRLGMGSFVVTVVALANDIRIVGGKWVVNSSSMFRPLTQAAFQYGLLGCVAGIRKRVAYQTGGRTSGAIDVR